MRSQRTSAAPPPIPARTWQISAITGAGAFMAMLDSTVANLAVESVRADFGSTLPVVQWIATGYLIALAVSLPATGWLGARYGQGRVWAVSLAVFTAASALCASAWDAPSLIVARVLQGLAAGLMVPAGQAIVAQVAERDQLGRLMGVLGLVVSLGPAVGPAVGGLLLEAASWRWLFWINVPVSLLALLAARGRVPGGEQSTTRTLDRRGLLLLGLGLPLFLYGGTEIGATGVSTAHVVAMMVGALLAGAFLLTARRAEHPLVDLALLRNSRFAAATTTTGLTGANMYGGLLLLPLYLQLVAGLDTAGTGLLLLAMGLGSAIALYVGGALTDRHGAGPVALTGAILLVLSTVPFLLPEVLPIPVIAILLVVRGIGLALTQMPATTAAYASVDKTQVGDAATVVNIVQRVGGALGAIVLVIVLAQFAGPTGYLISFAALTAVAAGTVLLALLVWRHTPARDREDAARKAR
ncbi:DHA2 family efflux MFS transporter permease subunit [Crossiella sp. NPDC003009]